MSSARRPNSRVSGAVATNAEGVLDKRRAAVPGQPGEHVVEHAEALEQRVVLKRAADAETRGLQRTDALEALVRRR